MSTLSPGTRLGGFEIVEPLGAGAMGQVYLAKDLKLRRQVAIKILPPEIASPELRKRFEREATAVAALNHPNIVHIYAIDAADDVHFLAMELVQGRSLAELLTGKPLATETILDIGTQLATGLAKAHEAGIVHRDLKPANVMVTDDGVVKILDFGLAKVLQSSGLLASKNVTKERLETETGTVMGTVWYMSPEQAAGEPLDHRSDQFSLGSVLYEMATGELAFRKTTVVRTLTAIIEDEPEPVAELNPELPQELVAIIERCLSKRPVGRYEETGDLARELRALQPSAALPSVPQRRVVPWLALGVVTAALALVAYFGPRADERAFPETEPPMHRRLTSNGHACSSSLSPDGEFLAYMECSDKGPMRVLVKDLDSGREVEVFQGSNLVRTRWSPDGKELFIAEQEQRLSHPATYLVPRLGGDARRLPDFSARAWSPDGSRLAGVEPGQPEIRIRELGTGSSYAIPLIGKGSRVFDLDWSPRTGRILFVQVHHDWTLFSMWTVDEDANNGHRVLEASSDRPVSPRWSADGDAIYFLRGHGEGFELVDLWTLPVSAAGEATAPATLVMSGLTADANQMDVSADGKQLVYSRGNFASNLRVVELPESSEQNAFESYALTTGTMADLTPRVSPDGDLVAFSRLMGDALNIFVVPLVGDAPSAVEIRESSGSW